jgi:hypothetical protein
VVLDRSTYERSCTWLALYWRHGCEYVRRLMVIVSVTQPSSPTSRPQAIQNRTACWCLQVPRRSPKSGQVHAAPSTSTKYRSEARDWLGTAQRRPIRLI